MLLSFDNSTIFVDKCSDDERIYSINALHDDVINPYVIVMTYADMVSEGFCGKDSNCKWDVEVSDLKVGEIAREEIQGMVIIRLK